MFGRKKKEVWFDIDFNGCHFTTYMSQYIGWRRYVSPDVIEKFYRQGKGLYFYIRSPDKHSGDGWFIKQLSKDDSDDDFWEGTWFDTLTIVNKEAYNAVLKDYEERRQESIAAAAGKDYEKVDYSTDGDA
jgi:hypothetical protein